MMPFDEEDEGWMWLDWEQLRDVQHEYNAAMNKLIDNALLTARLPPSPEAS